MKSKTMVLAVTMMALAAHGVAQDERATMRQQAEAFYQKVDRLIGKGDLNGYMNLLTKDFTFVNKQGQRTTKAELRDMITGMMTATRKWSSVTTVKNVQLQDKEAVIWTVNVMSWDQRQGNGWVRMKSTSRAADTLVKVNGAWKIKQTQELFEDEPWTFRTN